MRNKLHALLSLLLLLTVVLPAAGADETEQRLEQLRAKHQELVQQLSPLKNVEEKLGKEIEAAQLLYKNLGQMKSKLEAVQLWNVFATFMGGFFDLLQKTNPGNHAGVALVSFLQDRAGDELKKREPDFQMKLERASTALKQVQPAITKLNHAMDMTPQQVADQLHVRGMVDNTFLQHRWQQTPDAVAQTKAVVSGKITFILEELNATRAVLYAVRQEAGALLPPIIKQRTLLQREVDALYREIRQLVEVKALQEQLGKITVETPPDPADETPKLRLADIESASPMAFAEAFALIESAWLKVLDGNYSRQDYETTVLFAQEARRKKKDELLKPFREEYMSAKRAKDKADADTMHLYAKHADEAKPRLAAQARAHARYGAASEAKEKKEKEIAKADQEGFLKPLEELQATQRSYEAKLQDFRTRLAAFLDPPLVPGRPVERNNYRYLQVDRLFGSALYGLPLDLESRVVAADQALTDSSLHELATVVAAKKKLYAQFGRQLEELEVELEKATQALDVFREGVMPFVEKYTPEMLNLARFFGAGVKWYDPDELWENLQTFAPTFQSLRQQIPKPREIDSKLTEALSRNQRLEFMLTDLSAASKSARELADVQRRLASIYRNFESDGYRPSQPYRLLERFDNAHGISPAVNDQLRALLDAFKKKEGLPAYAKTLISSDPDFSRSNKERYPDPQRLADIGQQRRQLIVELQGREAEYKKLYAEFTRSYRVLDEQLSNLSRQLLPISPLWAYQADITQFVRFQITFEDPKDFPAGDDRQAVFDEYVALVNAYHAKVNKAVKQITFGLSDEELAAQERVVEDPSESFEEIRQREQIIGDFYASFREAYEGKNESLVMSLIHDDWSAAGGVTLFDLEDNLRNMYNVFDDIQYELAELKISRAGGNLYKVSYMVTIRGQIYDNDLRHEEVSAVVEQVIVEEGKVKIFKTLNGNYWSIQ